MAPTNTNTCVKCLKNMPNKDFLKCCGCKQFYDIVCAKVNEKEFRSMSPGKRGQFKCRSCLNGSTLSTDSACPPPRAPALLKLSQASASTHVTRSMTRNDSAEPSVADGFITESRLAEIIKHELGTTIREQVSGQLRTINEQMTSFSDAFTFFNVQFEEMKKRFEEKDAVIDQLKNDNAHLQSTVIELSSRLSSVEQQMRESNVEINGIPEHKAENLVNTVVNLAKVVDGGIADDDIVHVTRVAKINKDNDKPRAVVVKLRSPRHRDGLLAAVATFNKKNPKDKLSSQHLGIGGNKVAPVFVAEHLSPANKHLHAATRKIAKDTMYKFVWVRNGRIFVRKDEYNQAILVKSFDTLEQLKAHK